jgi:TDG/mug DNA glycosylase family protein
VARVTSFPPIEAPSAHTLILGTMPGTASLAAREYYAHPRNLFWTIFAEFLGFGRDEPYPARVTHLRTAGFAVWDVLQSCERRGSLDSDIGRTSIVANDFHKFFAGHPRIERVFFNGTAAATLFRRHVQAAGTAPLTINYTRLPSTSPANAGISPAAKRRAWRVVLEPAEANE